MTQLRRWPDNPGIERPGLFAIVSIECVSGKATIPQARKLTGACSEQTNNAWPKAKDLLFGLEHVY